MSVLIQRIEERLAACNTNTSRASLATGLGRQYIRDIVVGKSKSPSLQGLTAVARVLGCSVSYLIGETDDLCDVSQDAVHSPVEPLHVERKTNLAGLEAVHLPTEALPENEAREGGSHATPSRVSELLEYAQEVTDLLHALDKVGDGIGGADGFAVSAVALNAKYVADNLVNALKAMGAK
ncbi:MAG: helix-turn-helix transcriptional regulator [Agrobacterium cavarae]